ncbi:MAG: TrkH family potassium uptake protein [Gemmatimonadaceae bacterium]
MPARHQTPTLPGQFARWLPGTRRRRAFSRWLSPARFLVLSFAGLIVVGTLGFRLLPGLYVGAPLGWIDSLFIATSAVCVTGLTVVDPATYLTFHGQLWSLLLIQLGGLGLLTLTSGILLTVGRRLSLRHEELMRSTGDVNPEIDYRLLVRRVLAFTLIIESAGTAVLFIAWYDELGIIAGAWAAAFHAVSAFCNAGFSVFPGNLVAHQRDPLALGAVMVLIVLGGLGFLTLTELGRWLDRRSRSRRLSLHSRLVLVSTAIALLLGALAFGLFEWHHTLDGLSRSDRVVNALFGSVTARTAGFATVNYAEVTGPTAFATIVLMFIGGAPGSTAGGIKVTTIAILVVMAWSRLRGARSVNAFHRTIPDETLGRAAGIVVIAAAVLMLAIFVLVAVDPHASSPEIFLRYMFEAVSAFGTVGLSMDLTPSLSPGARLVIVALMFIGRVGIMSFAAALTLQPHTLAFRYAREDVAVG